MNVVSEHLHIDRVAIHLVRLPLNEPFETSFGSIDSRLIFLISVEGEGLTGWDEVVAAEKPRYSYETVGTAQHVIRDYLVPAVLSRPIAGLADLAARLAPFHGHNMAKAGLELAYMDFLARAKGQSLSQLIGGTRARIPVGVSLGIQPALDQLLERIDRYLALGYQRIKLKIKPGWDVDIVREVRRHYPDTLLSVDANSAYVTEDQDHLKALDDLGLLLIEQPLDHDDLIDHARRAEQALGLGSCRLINIKIGRVGGYSQAVAIHDLCHSTDMPVWCGGMLESGVGRAHNIALASQPGFSLPGDISASSRYFARDVIVPEVSVAADGTVEVPGGAGLGFEIDLDYIKSNTPKTSAALWRVVKPLVRSVESDEGLLIIDDSIEEKPSTDENELISWHYDHSTDRTVKGINFLTALYHAGEVSLPVAFDLVTKTEQYTDPKTNKSKRKSSLTKNERYRMLLRVAAHNQVKFKYVLNDVWFASSENMKFIKHQLKKEFVMPLKENRKVARTSAEKKLGQYVAVNRLELTSGATQLVWLEEMDFPLSLTKEVFTNEDASQGVRYLVSSDLTLTFDHLTKLYQKRWSIEVYHKSLKQNASLEKSPTRTPTTQRNHLFASLCAYVKLEALKIKSGVGHFTIKSQIYLSALKAAYAEVVKLNPQPLAA